MAFEQPAQQHSRVHGVTVDAHHFKFQLTVVQQNVVAGFHAARQVGNMQRHLDFIPLRGRQIAVFIHRQKNHLLANFDDDPIRRQSAHSQFRPLQILQDGDRLVQFVRKLANSINPNGMFFMRAMREIQAGNINTGEDQFPQRVNLLATGADRRDNFCVSRHTLFLLQAESGG